MHVCRQTCRQADTKVLFWPPAPINNRAVILEYIQDHLTNRNHQQEILIQSLVATGFIFQSWIIHYTFLLEQ